MEVREKLLAVLKGRLIEPTGGGPDECIHFGVKPKTVMIEFRTDMIRLRVHGYVQNIKPIETDADLIDLANQIESGIGQATIEHLLGRWLEDQANYKLARERCGSSEEALARRFKQRWPDYDGEILISGHLVQFHRWDTGPKEGFMFAKKAVTPDTVLDEK